MSELNPSGLWDCHQFPFTEVRILMLFCISQVLQRNRTYRTGCVDIERDLLQGIDSCNYEGWEIPRPSGWVSWQASAPGKANVSVWVQRQEKGKIPVQSWSGWKNSLLLRTISLFVLVRPSTDCIRPTHTREDNVFYSLYPIKVNHTQNPLTEALWIMFDHISEHLMAQSEDT